jgi:hypothetical protein
VARNGPRRDYTISEVSGEERIKRKQWAAEARARREAKAKLEAERESAEAARKRASEEERLEARRVSIRERIERQHEIARKNADVRAAAEARARSEVSGGPPGVARTCLQVFYTRTVLLAFHLQLSPARTSTTHFRARNGACTSMSSLGATN